MKSKKHRLRFNLGAGENYMKWKHTNPSGFVEYFNPSEVSFVCKGAKLRNQKGTAKKIFSGENKTVCAWIDCDTLMVFRHTTLLVDKGSKELAYNPRVAPHWRDDAGNDLDNSMYDELMIVGRKVFTENL